MMMALVKIAKKYSKHMTCIGFEPDIYEGKIRLNRFKYALAIINELADELHLFDFTSSDIDRTHEYADCDVMMLNQSHINT
jgi:hypothetical protein